MPQPAAAAADPVTPGKDAKHGGPSHMQPLEFSLNDKSGDNKFKSPRPHIETEDAAVDAPKADRSRDLKDDDSSGVKKKLFETKQGAQGAQEAQEAGKKRRGKKSRKSRKGKKPRKGKKSRKNKRTKRR